MQPGSIVGGKQVAALKALGFDAVFDTCMSADMTIMAFLLGTAPDMANPSKMLGTSAGLKLALAGFSSSALALVGAAMFIAVYFPANGMCQGVGEGFHATFYALLALGLRVVFAYALHKTSLFGYTAIWWSQAMSWTITLVVCYVHFFRGKWKDKSLIS